jgi:exosortase F-associated protein
MLTQQIVNHKLRIAVTIPFILLLVLIRVYEDALFYDPFLNYFKADYFNLPLPEIDALKLFFGLGFRYFLNTILSLGIIFILFRDIQAIKFSILLYSFFFILLIILLYSLLYLYNEPNKMTLFYVRRFLIQPIFLLLFLPAFYYQFQTTKD